MPGTARVDAEADARSKRYDASAQMNTDPDAAIPSMPSMKL